MLHNEARKLLLKALVAALTSQTVKDYIDSTYDGAVVAIF